MKPHERRTTAERVRGASLNMWFQHGLESSDPVALADAKTTQADLRTALCLAGGTPPEDICRMGFDISRLAYEKIRAQWQGMLHRNWYWHRDITDARRQWRKVRPEWTDQWWDSEEYALAERR